jgi:biotin carboxylase
MRILLSEGSGLTSRQVAGRLWTAGHHVGVVSCDPRALTRFTRACQAWHRVPDFGVDPLAWLDATIDTYQAHGYDVLLPTQEQVTVLAAVPKRLQAAGVRTAVPSFAALSCVQDKLAAHATLTRLGLPQPATTIAVGPAELTTWDEYPVYLKTPIGTATSGVHLLRSGASMDALVASGALEEAFMDGGVVLQRPMVGPVVMTQAVFERGRMLAFHANLRTRLGVRGGASHKCSITVPDVRCVIDELGTELDWHGALSADLVLTETGPMIIDINPRLVEPGNAYASGVDLTKALLDVAIGTEGVAQPQGQPDVNTHQLLLAVLGAAEKGTRCGLVREVFQAITHKGDYSQSTEELTPVHRDLRAITPVVAAVLSTTARPSTWQWFSSGSVTNYAVTPAAWRTIRRHAEP